MKLNQNMSNLVSISIRNLSQAREARRNYKNHLRVYNAFTRFFSISKDTDSNTAEQDTRSDWNLDSYVSESHKLETWVRRDLNIVLVEPRIPQNVGAVARTCAATGVRMHLIGPMGFSLNDKKMKRAGLDYWPHVCVKIYDGWGEFRSFFESLSEPKRLIAFSARADIYYGAPEFQYQSGDWLLFGSETSGLSDEVWDFVRQTQGKVVKLPIRDGFVRSVNLAVAAGVGIFEAIRQLDEGAHIVHSRDRDPITAAAVLEQGRKKMKMILSAEEKLARDDPIK